MKKSFLPGLLFTLLLVSCSGRIRGMLYEDGFADLSLNAALEPRMTALIRGLSAAMKSSAAPGGVILDAQTIGRSMAQAPGILEVDLKNTSPSALEGSIKISQIEDLLAFTARNTVPGTSSPEKVRFITYEKSSTGGKVILSLGRSSAPALLALFSGETSAYLAALMAPVATGEIMTRDEYLVLVGDIYGKAVADEIGSAKLYVSISFPGPIRSCLGGSYSGRRAEFVVDLPDLLVLDKDLRYEVIWQK
jgi:hypothetical protein